MPSASRYGYKNKKSLESRLQNVSLENQRGSLKEPSGGGLSSQYHENYQPMFQGEREQLWQEGYHQRIERKQNGFNHFKLEWMAPTDRR